MPHQRRRSVVLALVGGSTPASGVRQVRRISIGPPQTAETLRENVPWLPNQT
jgi:hypothetical protein